MLAFLEKELATNHSVSLCLSLMSPCLPPLPFSYRELDLGVCTETTLLTELSLKTYSLSVRSSYNDVI